MTFNNNVSIKQEPISPPTDTISQHHFSGSSLIYRSDSGASAYSASPQSGTTAAGAGLGAGSCYPPVCSLPRGAAEEEFKWSPATTPHGSTSPSNPKSTLKQTILSRRRAKGQEDVGKLFEEPRTYQLTKADIERREKRREQNRRAAKKCRIKKKSLQSVVSEESERFKIENMDLRIEIDRLEKQVQFLSGVIETHVTSGCCNLQDHLELQTDVQYEAPMTTTPPYGSDVTHALAGAHSALNSDQQTGGLVSVVDSGLPSLPSLDFGKISNLPSWDLSRIDPDLIIGGAEYSEVYPSFGHGVVGNEDVAQHIHCVNPNLVQQQQVVPPSARASAAAAALHPTAATKLINGHAFALNVGGGDGDAQGQTQPRAPSASGVAQGGLDPAYQQLQCGEMQFQASYINGGGHYSNSCEEVYGQHFERQYYANQRH